MEETSSGIAAGVSSWPGFIRCIHKCFSSCLYCNICILSDDTKRCVCDKSLNLELETLEDQSNFAMAWFENKYLGMNSDKWNLYILDNISEQVLASIREHKTWGTRTVKLLDISVDNNLRFDEHLITCNICMKANKKLTALTRLRKYLDNDTASTLFQVLFESQFQYCPLT